MVQVDELLKLAYEKGASDLHISVNTTPSFRINGALTPFGEVLRPNDTESMARHILSNDQWEQFVQRGELDFSYSIHNVSRFRVNVYRQRGTISIAFRIVPNHIPAFESLGLPLSIQSLTEKMYGLVLVTGPTGSGKSTTLASLIDQMNQTQRRHIITLEDPIEYLHRHNHSIIDQREIGIDTKGFAPALRAALRQDPDVIMVGEMRDVETISTAITAAETGHLVFATLHTSDAVQTIDRVIDVFPNNQQAQVRMQMASVLQAVIAQRLHTTKDGCGRIASVELLMNTPAVSNLIRTEKTHQLRSVMQTGRQYGMQTMEMHMKELIQEGKISEQVLQQWGPVAPNAGV